MKSKADRVNWTVEVKAARRGTPKRIYEVLASFANRSGGGVIIFGLDESSDFTIIGVGDAHRLQEEITNVDEIESINQKREKLTYIF